MKHDAFSTLAPGRHSPSASAPPLDSIVAAAHALIPALRAAAPQTEQARRLPETLNRQFHDAGFYRSHAARALRRS